MSDEYAEIIRESYVPRLIDPVVDLHLRAFGAVEIAGTMWSGKTWTAIKHGKSRVSLDDKQAKSLAEIDASAVLAGERPHVVDEWQEVPQIWDTVRNKVDSAAGQRGLYILTGSSRPAREKTQHTGSGRISRLKMWPMSLYESGHSTGEVSLSGLFDGCFESGPTKTSLEKLASLACRGGWPGAMNLDDQASALIPRQYLDALFAKDDKDAPGSERELRQFLRALARNIGGSVTLKTIARDMGLAEAETPSDAEQRR